MALHTNRNCATGVLEDYSGGTLQYGRLLCDGSVYAIATYPKLFAVIGATYGGDGITTFAVPDIRGRTTAGLDTNPGGGYANRLTAGGSGINSKILGVGGGVEVETLTAAQSGLPAHGISVSGSATGLIDGGIGSHEHTIGTGAGYSSGGSGTPFQPGGGGSNTSLGPTLGATSMAHSHNVAASGSVSAANASSPHQVTQPTLVVVKTIMYA